MANQAGDEDKKKKWAAASEKIMAFTNSSIKAITDFGKASYSAASEFENSMAKIQMATGATNEQMMATKMIAKDLYKQNLGGSWDDLAGTLTETIKLTDQQGIVLEQTAKNALLLKDSIGVDVSDSVKSADSVMKNFGITSNEAFGLIAQGAHAKLDTGQLTGAAESYAEDFKKLGFNANQMFDIFAAGSQDGKNSLDQIGKTFQQFQSIAGSGSAKSSGALTSLGLNAQQVQKSITAGGPAAQAAFKQIAQSIGRISDPVKQNAAATALFGSQFGDMEGQVVAAMGNARSQFDMTKQTMSELNQLRISSPGAALEIFKKQVATDILIPVGEKLIPALSRLGAWLTSHEPMLKKFGTGLANIVGKAIDFIASNLEKILPYLDSFAKFALDVWNKAIKWQGLVPVVTGLVGALGAYKAIVTTVTTVTKVWGAVSTLLEANPIILIIAAIIGLGIGLVMAYKKCEWFRNAVDGVWAFIKNAFSATMNFFVVTIPKIFNAVVSFISKWAPEIIAVLLGPIIGGIFYLVYTIVKNWDSIKAYTINVFNQVVSYLTALWQNLWGTAVTIFNTIAAGISGIWTALQIRISEIVGGLVNFIVVQWTAIWNNTVSIYNLIINAVSTAWSNIWNSITWVVLEIVNFITNNWTNLWDTTVSIFNNITDSILQIWTIFKDNFMNVFSGVAEFFSNLWKGISSWFMQGINWVIDQVNGLIDKLNKVLNIEIYGHKLGINIPTIDHVVSGWAPKKENGAGNAAGGSLKAVAGSYKTGLAYVPYNGFIAELHKGERVLTAEENQAYSAPLAAPVKVAPGSGISSDTNPGTGGSFPSGTMNINLSVDVKGGSLSSQQTGDLTAQFRQAMQQVFQETMRRGGLEGAS
jgi:phage-related minor tail protein